MEGGGRREVFLSAHRCPEVDLLPRQPPAVLPEKRRELTCPGEGGGYLDVLSSDEGSVSDWSEEDLSLHFSPSVIQQSDDEEPDLENGFECVDVTMETQAMTRKGEGLRMVPKRQIQLRKKEEDNMADQVIQDRGSPQRGGVHNRHHRQDLLLRQHSMPAFQASSRTDAEVDGCKVYRGPVSGAGQGSPRGGNARRLQKSLSLDETKTMMASCIIKKVLTKKMQGEQIAVTTKDLKKKPGAFPAPPPPTGDAGGGGGAVKAPVHVVRDVRSLVKHTYNLPFPTATRKPVKPTSFKMIGPKESPPPTYQQAVGVKGPVAMVAGSVGKSQSRKESDAVRRPIRESVVSRTKGADVTCPAMMSQSERAATPPPHPGFIQPPPPQEQGPAQPVLHPCFYAPPHLGRVSFVHAPLSYVQTHLPPPAPSLHPPRRPEDDQNRSTETWSRAAGDPDGWVGAAQVSAAVVRLMLDPKTGRGFYVDTPPPPQRKLLVDPETGQVFQVFLPAVGSAPCAVPLRCAGPAPTVLHVGGANPAVLSVMPFPPLMAVPSLYGTPCLPVTVATPAAP